MEGLFLKRRLGRHLFPIFTFIAFSYLHSCHPASENNHYLAYIDTTVKVYGSYIAVKLPIDKGTKVSNPIRISLGPNGVMYAANQNGEVYALIDSDGDGLEDAAQLFCNVKDYGMRSPAGFAHRGDTIFIGTAQGIRAFLDKNKDGVADSSWLFFDDIPTSEHPYEWTCALTFGPDGWLYCSLSTDSWNAAPSPDPNGYRGALLKISPDGKIAEKVATGIRSVYGLSFNQLGDLFFTDNEGGGNPREELNRLIKNGFYGHNPSKYQFETVTGPEHMLLTEAAPSGIEFNSPENDFGGTGGNLFVAFYGPGERWNRGGVGRIKIVRNNDGTYSYEEFPVADIPKLSDLAFGKDGSLYLASHGKTDYWYNAVFENQGGFYKLIYDPAIQFTPKRPTVVANDGYSENTIEMGRQLFAEQACLGCHAVDGQTELLGPNLKDVGKRLSREEILEEIREPSKIIKPSMAALKVRKKDGQNLIGRAVSSDENHLSLMLIGNQVVEIPRDEIVDVENDMRSLMYEGLVHNLSQAEIDALLDYIMSLSE